MGLFGFGLREDAVKAYHLVKESERDPRWRRYGVKRQQRRPGLGGGAAFLARRYGTPLPARADDDTLGGPTAVKKCVTNPTTGAVTETGDIEVYSWVQSVSADPADDPKGYIYVWIEEGEDGQLYWTGEDCPVIDPGEPVEELPSGGQAPDNANLILVT